MYSWNQRTRTLDELAASVGLELSGAVLKAMRATEDVVSGFWERYFDLVGVREENERLKARLADLESRLLANGEDLAELKRLRALIQLPVDKSWRPLGARVLAGRARRWSRIWGWWAGCCGPAPIPPPPFCSQTPAAALRCSHRTAARRAF